jgi:hypothetical protein
MCIYICIYIYIYIYIYIIDTLELNWQGNVTARGIRKNNTIYFEIKKGKNDVDYNISSMKELNVKDDYDRHSDLCQDLNEDEDFVCFDIGDESVEEVKSKRNTNNHNIYNNINHDSHVNNEIHSNNNDNSHINNNNSHINNNDNHINNDDDGHIKADISDTDKIEHKNNDDDNREDEISFRLIGSLQWVKGKRTNRLRNILCNSKGEETHTIIRYTFLYALYIFTYVCIYAYIYVYM